jgi:outer membrane protein TolC
MFRGFFIYAFVLLISLVPFARGAHAAAVSYRHYNELNEAYEAEKLRNMKVDISVDWRMPSEGTVHESDVDKNGNVEGKGGAQKGSMILGLDDCVRMAVERNERLIAAGYDIEAAKGQLLESKAQFWPVIEYQYRIAPVPNDVSDAFNKFFEGENTLFNSIHVGIGMPITTFGQLRVARDMAEGGVEAARIKHEAVKNDTIYQVKKIYYGIQLANETMKLLQDAVDKMDKKVRDDDEREVKEMDPYDKLQLKMFREEMAKRLDEMKQNLSLAYDGLRLQLDLDPDTPINIDSNQLRPMLRELAEEEKFFDEAGHQVTDSKLLDIGVETKRKQYKLEKMKLLPHAGFGFFVDVGRTTGYVSGVKLTDDFNNPFNYTRAGFGLQLGGTLDFHGATAKIRKARAEYFKASFEKEIARKGLSLDLKKSYLEAERLKRELIRAKQSESMAEQMVFLTKMNIDTGIGDEQKYADSLKALLLTRGQYFKSVFDFNMAMADLEKKIGMETFAGLSRRVGESAFDVPDKEQPDTGSFYQDNHTDMEGIENED